MKYVIAIDGPAGSGKSTVSAMVAGDLGFIHADSGAIYRTVTLALIRRLGADNNHVAFGKRLADAPFLSTEELQCTIVLKDGIQVNMISGTDVGDEIRTQIVTDRIRYVADSQEYRNSVNRLLRSFGEEASLVVDGRDIGSVVFPESPYKFFLTATPDERARRRLTEMGVEQINPEIFEEMLSKIHIRDREDENRPIGALKQAEDAILIDTSDLTIKDVVARILMHLQKQF